MTKDKMPIATSSSTDSNLTTTPAKESDKHHKSSDSNTSQQFLKLTKLFAVDGALLPPEKQMPIEDRCEKRARLLHLRKQQNIESIMQKTLAYCASSEVKQRTDQDWFSRYINLAEGISNTTMQDLWAKILAGELTKPGSFSFKALQVFRDMSIFDAKLFAKACSLAVQDQSKRNIRIFSGSYQQPGLLNWFSKERIQGINLSHYGLNYADLLALAENHLIYMQESELSLSNTQDKLTLNYNGLPLKLTARKANTNIQFYKFTPIGTELAQLISDKPNEDFFNNINDVLSKHFNVTN